MRIIQHAGSNLIITKHAKPHMLIQRKHREGRGVTVTERESKLNLRGNGRV